MWLVNPLTFCSVTVAPTKPNYKRMQVLEIFTIFHEKKERKKIGNCKLFCICMEISETLQLNEGLHYNIKYYQCSTNKVSTMFLKVGQVIRADITWVWNYLKGDNALRKHMLVYQTLSKISNYCAFTFLKDLQGSTALPIQRKW